MKQIAVLVTIIFSACSSEDSSNKFRDIEGYYYYFQRDLINSCNFTGPIPEFNVKIAQLTVDNHGQGSLIIGGTIVPVFIDYENNIFNIETTNNNCILKVNNKLVNCSDDKIVIHIRLRYDMDINRFFGIVQIYYGDRCGIDENKAGIRMIKIEGNWEGYAQECRNTSFHCYSELDCNNKLPDCVIIPSMCNKQFTKSYRSIETDICTNLK